MNKQAFGYSRWLHHLVVLGGSSKGFATLPRNNNASMDGLWGFGESILAFCRNQTQKGEKTGHLGKQNG